MFLSIEGYWRELLLALCKPVYKFIVYLYSLFEAIGTAEILTNETISTIYNRIGLLLGVYMMFRIIFAFIQMLINPDYITDKEKGIGNIAKKAILVVVLMGIVPFIFEKAMELQNFIVGVNNNENIIANIVLPAGSAYVDSNSDIGVELSAYLFSSFYRYDDNIDTLAKDPNVKNCLALNYVEGSNEITNLYDSIINTNGDISYAKSCLDEKWEDKNDGEEKYQITFTSNGLLALIVGIVVCYTLIMYTLMVGVRVIQLAFLRMISPMAILGYLSPKKDGMFEKWLKMCTTTYIDLFIRMAIIYFVIFVIRSLIGETGIALVKNFEPMWIINVVMIIALLLFAKKAPELLKELFPKSGIASLGFGLKSPKQFLNDNPLLKGVLGGAAAAGTAGAVGLIRGGASRFGHVARHWDTSNRRQRAGMFLGAIGGTVFTGLRGIGAGAISRKTKDTLNKQQTQIGKFDDWSQAGGTSSARRIASGILGSVAPNATQGHRDKARLDALNDFIKTRDNIEAAADNTKEIKTLKKIYDSVLSGGQLAGETDIQFAARIQAAEKAYKDRRKEVISYVASGTTSYTYNDVSGNPVTVDLTGLDREYRANMAEARRIRQANENFFDGNNVGDPTDYDSLDGAANSAKSVSNAMPYDPNYRAGQANDAYNGNNGKR